MSCSSETALLTTVINELQISVMYLNLRIFYFTDIIRVY